MDCCLKKANFISICCWFRWVIHAVFVTNNDATALLDALNAANVFFYETTGHLFKEIRFFSPARAMLKNDLLFSHGVP